MGDFAGYTCREQLGENVVFFSPQECFFSEGHRYSIVGDIRIYNKAEIALELGLLPEMPSLSDAHFLLHCYTIWGRNCLQKVVGDFAFGLWDEEKQELFCAVDHLGVKSLFYRVAEDSSFLFSGELRDIVMDTPKKCPLNEAFLMDYLLGVYQEQGRTVYENIFSLAPGKYLLVNEEGVTCHQYWRPVVGSTCNETESESNAERLKKILVESVRCRLSNEQGNGVLLSGGLDSAAITCIVNSVLSGWELSAFSQVLPEGHSEEERDEREYIECVSDYSSTSVSYCSKNAAMDAEGFVEYFQSQYTIPFNPFFCISAPLFQDVSQNGVGVLFTGNGGDNVVSNHGAGCYALMARKGHFLNLLQILRKNAHVEGRSLVRVFRSKVIGPLVPSWLRNLYRKHRGLSCYDPVGQSFVRKELVEKFELHKRIRQRGAYVNVAHGTDPREDMVVWIANNYFSIAFDQDAYLLDRYSIRCVHPLLDKRIVDFVMSVPPEEFVQGGWHRSLFRRAMDGVLPHRIQYRKGKMPFCGTKAECLRKSREYVKKILECESNPAWQIIDRNRLSKQVDALLSCSEPNASLEAEAYDIGRCLVVAAFLQWNSGMENRTPVG